MLPYGGAIYGSIYGSNKWFFPLKVSRIFFVKYMLVKIFE